MITQGSVGCFFLKHKSNALKAFKEWKAQVENETRQRIKILRTDRGGEFNSEAFDSYCIEHGIFRQLTAAYSAQQNGVAERKHRTTVEMSLNMLKGRNLSKAYDDHRPQ